MNDDDAEQLPPGSLVHTAIVFEGGLALLAMGLGWLVSVSPLASIPIGPGALAENGLAVLWGVIAALPMMSGPLLIHFFPYGPLGRLQEFVERIVVPMFSQATIAQLALISLLAGLGEEMLFRGLIQGGLAERIGGTTGVVVGVAVASIAFGIAHWMTRTYALLATIVGVYLGLLMVFTGNILAPMVTHALYDFVVLVFMLRRRNGAAR